MRLLYAFWVRVRQFFSVQHIHTKYTRKIKNLAIFYI